MDLPAWLAHPSPLFLVGWGAVAVVVACWLTVSFAAAPTTKLRAGWLGASAMYVALCCLFLSAFLGAASVVGRIGFGFLFAFFSVGFVLAARRTLRALGSRESGKLESATH